MISTWRKLWQPHKEDHQTEKRTLHTLGGPSHSKRFSSCKKADASGGQRVFGPCIHLADIQHPHDFLLQESAFFGLCHHTRSLVIAWMWWTWLMTRDHSQHLTNQTVYASTAFKFPWGSTLPFQDRATETSISCKACLQCTLQFHLSWVSQDQPCRLYPTV